MTDKTLDERQNEATIKALLCGDDLTEHEAARVFLRELLECSFANTKRLTVPIARRLMRYPGWHLKLTLATVTRYCSEREWVFKVLNALPWQKGIDPEAEYLSGMAEDLRSRLEL